MAEVSHSPSPLEEPDSLKVGLHEGAPLKESTFNALRDTLDELAEGKNSKPLLLSQSAPLSDHLAEGLVAERRDSGEEVLGDSPWFLNERSLADYHVRIMDNYHGEHVIGRSREYHQVTEDGYKSIEVAKFTPEGIGLSASAVPESDGGSFGYIKFAMVNAAVDAHVVGILWLSVQGDVRGGGEIKYTTNSDVGYEMQQFSAIFGAKRAWQAALSHSEPNDGLQMSLNIVLSDRMGMELLSGLQHIGDIDTTDR
jgi:hypothetical protein